MGNMYATIAVDNGDKFGWPGTPDDTDGGTDPNRYYWEVQIRDLEKVSINDSIDKLFLASETEAGVVLSIKEANEVINHLKLLKETADKVFVSTM